MTFVSERQRAAAVSVPGAIAVGSSHAYFDEAGAAKYLGFDGSSRRLGLHRAQR